MVTGVERSPGCGPRGQGRREASASWPFAFLALPPHQRPCPPPDQGDMAMLDAFKTCGSSPPSWCPRAPACELRGERARPRARPGRRPARDGRRARRKRWTGPRPSGCRNRCSAKGVLYGDEEAQVHEEGAAVGHRAPRPGPPHRLDRVGGDRVPRDPLPSVRRGPRHAGQDNVASALRLLAHPDAAIRAPVIAIEAAFIVATRQLGVVK